MAEERDVIINVEVDEKNFEQEIGKVNSELRENRKEIKELSKDYDNNSEEIAKLELQNKKLSASKRELTKESDTQSNSLNALRLQLANQTKERNNLNVSTEEGAARFEELQTSIKGLNDEISGFEQAGGDFRRNVGNYPELLGDAVGGVKFFGQSLSELFQLLLLNPFLIVVSAVTALIKVFSESQTGIEFFRTASAALNIVLAKLSDLVEELGKTLIEAFSSPQDTLNSLVKTIEDGVFRYFNEFIPNAITKVLDGFGLLREAVKQVFQGDFDAALETATEGTIKLVDGLTDINPATALIKEGFEAAIPAISAFNDEVQIAIGQATALEERLIANEKAQADLEVTRAESIKTLKELNLIIEDTTKADEERLAAADEAARIEEELLNRRLELQRELVEIIREQNDLANSTEEDVQRLRDAEIDFFNREAESLERSTTLNNKRNTLINQQIAKEEAQRKKDAARIKKEEAEAKKKEAAERKDLQERQEFESQVARKGLADTANILNEETFLGKTAAIAQIATNSAIGVSAAVKAGAGLTFPANILAIASGIAAVASGISQANNILGSSSNLSVQSVSGTGAAVNDSLSSSISVPTTQAAATSQSTAEALASIPAPQVAVTDINDGQNDRSVVVTESEL